MTGFVRGFAVVAVALAAACSRGGSGGNAGSSGSAASEGTRSADGVVASVSEGAVKVKTQDGRVLDFPMKDDVKVTLGGGEASSAVVTEGAPVRVSFKEGGKGNELVSIDVEPREGSGGAATAPPPAGSAAGQGPSSR
jgi:ABC-type Fe3+-hydroxamate transport system substrate-binding protein